MFVHFCGHLHTLMKERRRYFGSKHVKTLAPCCFLHQNSLEMIGNGDFELIQETHHSRPVGHSSQQRTRNGLPLRHPMGRDSQRTGPRRTMESVDRMFPVGCWVQLRL